jgi:hypothetical protein
LEQELHFACIAFDNKNFLDAWLYLGLEGKDDDWFDHDNSLFGRPIYHTPYFLKHSGHDGEQQRIIPLWFGDVSTKLDLKREFESRLANSGDY